MKVRVPPADWKKLAQKLKANVAETYRDVEPRRGGYGKGVFYEAMPIVDPLPENGAILQAMAPTASRLACRRLHASHAFAWVYSNEARFRPHIDFQEIDYFLSISVQQDAPWSIASWESNAWRIFEHEEGEGVLLRGGAAPHTRPRYDGKECIILLLTYCESPEGAARKARLTGRRDLTEPEIDDALAGIGFDRTALWDRRLAQERPTVFDIPIDADLYAKVREDAYRRLYAQQADGTPAVYYGTVSSDLIPFHIEVGKVIERRLGRLPHNGEAWGWHFRDNREESVALDDPRWDWRVVLPLDDAAAVGPVRIERPDSGVQTLTLARGQGLLLAGHDWNVTMRGRPYPETAQWAAMAFQERGWVDLPGGAT